MRKQIFFTLVLAFTISQSHAGESACKTLKEDIRNTQSLTESQKRNLRDEIFALIKADEMCAKNLLGRMYYEGGVIEKDVDKAEAIFYDLSQKAYPPALYNFAYLKIKQGSTDAEETLAYLHGIMVKYAEDDQWKHLVVNARDLGWDYLEKLSSNASFTGDLNQLRENHSFVAKNTRKITDAFFASYAKHQAYVPDQGTVRSEVGGESFGFDTILSIIQLGLSIANYHYSSKASEISRQRLALAIENNKRALQLKQTTPRGNAGPYGVAGNPLQPDLHLVVPTGSPNVVYTQRITPFGSFGTTPRLYNVSPAGEIAYMQYQSDKGSASNLKFNTR